MLLLAFVNPFTVYSYGSSVRWPALYADYPLALKWREKAERVIHQGLMKVNNPLSSGDKQQAESPTIPRLELGYPTSERIAAV